MSCKLSFLFPPRSKSAPESLLGGYFHVIKQTIISSNVTFGLPVVIQSLISRIKEKQNKKRQEKTWEEEEEKARNMSSYRETIFRIKRENGELETSLREADFFSRRVKKEPKKSSAPRRLNGNAQSLVLYPRKEVLAEVILRRKFNTLLCLCCSFVIGLPMAKKKWVYGVYVEERRNAGGRISQKALLDAFPPAVGRFLKGEGMGYF